MVRVLCIGFMIYVHVPDNAISAIATGVPLASQLFQGFLVEGVGRASAALLSLVSGLLTAVALSRGEAVSLYRRRFRSIVLPMLFWSTLTVGLYALLSFAQPTFLSSGDRSLPESVLFYANAVLFLSDQPMGPTLHLGFLRDLFVCILLAPLLIAALRRAGVLVPLLLGALYLLDVESIVILRPLVLFAFSIGLWLALGGWRLEALDAAWPLWIALSALATCAVMLSGTEAALDAGPSRWFAEQGLDLRETLLYPASRLFGGLAIWTLAAKLVGSGWSARLGRLSPYVFVAFCSHFLVLTILWETLVRPLVGASDTLGYALWFASAPFVAMAAAIVIVASVSRVVPSLATLLTGGRVRESADAARTAARSPTSGRMPPAVSGSAPVTPRRGLPGPSPSAAPARAPAGAIARMPAAAIAGPPGAGAPNAGSRRGEGAVTGDVALETTGGGER